MSFLCPMLASASQSVQQSWGCLEDLPPVPGRQRRGNKRLRVLHGERRDPHPPGQARKSLFHGGISFISLFAIVFFAIHCFAYIRREHASWLHRHRRLADKQQRGRGDGMGKDDLPPCEWLNDARQGSSEQPYSSPSFTIARPSEMDARPAGHGFKRLWENADEEDLQRLSKMQKKTADVEGAITGEDLSAQLEDFIEEALAGGTTLKMEPWLLDPGLQLPTGILFEGEEAGETLFSQGCPETETSMCMDGTIRATTVTIPLAGTSSAASAGMDQHLSQTAWATVTQMQQPSTAPHLRDPRIFSHWCASINPSVSLQEQTEHGRISGAIQGPSSHVIEPKDSGLQVYYSYDERPKAAFSPYEQQQPNFSPSPRESGSLKSAPVPGVDLCSHPFYRTSQLLPGVVPRTFNMEFALAASGTVVSPLRPLAHISSWLKMEALNSLRSNVLMGCLEELVGFAMHNVKRSLKVVRPVFAVETLALYLLVVDSLYAASATLGESAQSCTWWNRIMAELPTQFVLGSQAHPRGASRKLLSLAERIKDAFEIFRSGARPSPAVLVPLKQEILCSGLIRKFQRGGWRIFKEQDDEWRLQKRRRL